MYNERLGPYRMKLNNPFILRQDLSRFQSRLGEVRLHTSSFNGILVMIRRFGVFRDATLVAPCQYHHELISGT